MNQKELALNGLKLNDDEIMNNPNMLGLYQNKDIQVVLKMKNELKDAKIQMEKYQSNLDEAMRIITKYKSVLNVDVNFDSVDKKKKDAYDKMTSIKMRVEKCEKLLQTTVKNYVFNKENKYHLEI